MKSKLQLSFEHVTDDTYNSTVDKNAIINDNSKFTGTEMITQLKCYHSYH